MSEGLEFTFGDKLRKVRRNLDMTQDELQRRMNEYGVRWHRSAVAAIENDRRDLTIKELWIVCKVLSVSPDYFLPPLKTPLKKDPVEAWTQAEHNLAESLGVDTEMIASLSVQLWKRSFHAERERRLAKTYGNVTNRRSRQALRGHVTREMRKELEEAINDGD